jgi:hypothetical protein
LDLLLAAILAALRVLSSLPCSCGTCFGLRDDIEAGRAWIDVGELASSEDARRGV